MADNLLEHKTFLLNLLSCKGVGRQTAWKIFQVCQHRQIPYQQFYLQCDSICQQLAISEKIAGSIQKFNKEHNFFDSFDELQTAGIQLVSFEEPAYPKLLLEISDFPLLLFVKSQVKVGGSAWQDMFAKTLSVVGTRKISSYGHLVLKEFIPALVAAERVVVSGFMYGVDLAAAQLALASGGQTIAVLGYGFKHCFPASQKRTFQTFLEQGAVFISEFPPATLAKAGNFVIRNRIIAALSAATLVIEAAIRSGSHITAHCANDYGRTVMAVPGPITNPFSEGTKKLINEGAILVNSAQDVLAELMIDYGSCQITQSTLQPALKKKAQNLLDQLSCYPSLAFADLQAHSQLSSRELNQLLFDLEIQGRITKKWGKYCLVS